MTIEYYDGRPLGALLGAMISSTDGAGEGDPSFIRPMLIGLEATFTPKHDGQLFVRVNESPNKLGDNAGELSVNVERAPR